MSVVGIYKGLEYEPLRCGEGPFVMATQRRRHATQWRSVVRCGEGLASQQRRELRNCGLEGVVFAAADQKARLKNVALHSGEASFAAVDQKA